MPTAAKLVASICFGIIAIMLGLIWWANSPFNDNPAFLVRFLPVICALGVFSGWYNLGQDPHLGGFRSLALGLQTSLILAIVIIVFFAFWRVGAIMVSGAVISGWTAFQTLVNYMGTHASAIFQPWPVGILILGGLIAGRLSGLAQKYWK